MAAETGLAEVLPSFITSTDSATAGLPDSGSVLPPANGITLLDAKTEIFLSYLQALALRNLHVIRSLKDGDSPEESQELSDAITRKLIEHRVYLERGVRPLENKIKYQVDKVIKAADDEARAEAQPVKNAAKSNGAVKERETGSGDASDEDEDEDSEDEDEDDVEKTSYRPNAASFVKATEDRTKNADRRKEGGNGVYRPPRVSATSMPTTEQREAKERKPVRSRTLDEYVNTELLNAPLAEPSVGSTIAEGGRSSKDARQLAKEKERRDYEETNLVRLPPTSKKDRAQSKAGNRGRGFGGEEWTGLTDSVDRIGNLTRKKGKDTALDKSRKRRATEDGPRSDGVGAAFEQKKRRVMKKMRR